MSSNKQKKEMKGSAVSVIIAAIIIINLISGMMAGEVSDEVFVIVPLAIIVIAAVTILRAAKKAAAGKKADAGSPARAQSARERQQPGIRLHASHPAVTRNDYSAPDPYCVVCDQTGEDHFQRDRAQRIAQLDEWLKNGLIDKAEYRALKERYEKNM